MPGYGYVPQETVDANGNPVTIAVRQQLPDEAPPDFMQPQQPTTYDQLSPNGMNAGGMSAEPPVPEVSAFDTWFAAKKAGVDGPRTVPPNWAAMGAQIREWNAAKKPGVDRPYTPEEKAARGEAPAPDAAAAPRVPYPGQAGTGGSGVAAAQTPAPGGENASLRFSVPMGGGVGGPRGMGQDMKALNAVAAKEEASNQALYEVGRQKATVEAGYAQQTAELAEKQRQEAVVFQQHRKEAMDAQAKTFQEAQDEVAKVNTTVDPNRYWASKGTGSKVLAAIASAMGAFGAALTGGKNYALEIIEKAVNDDIDAQKQMNEMQLRKGNAKVAATQTLYGLMRSKYDDDATALAATHAAAYGVIQQKLGAAMAGIGGAEAKAKLDQLNAAVGAKTAEAKIKLGQQFDESARGWAGIQNQRLNIMMDAQEKARAASRKETPKVPATEAAAVGGLEGVDKMIDDLDKAWKDKTGVASFITKHLPGTPSARYEDNKLLAAQAIGTPLEGGKLTDSDLRDKYLRLMPDSDDSEARKKDKLAALRLMVQRKRDAQVKGLGAGGYDVSGFSASPLDQEAALGAKRR